MKRLLTTILLSLVCCAANAEWTPLIKGVSHGSSIDIDRSTFKRDGDSVKLWTRWDYDKEEDFGGIKYRSTISLIEINCKQDSDRTIFASVYAGQKGEGKKVAETNQSDADWRPLQPETMFVGLAKWACRT